MFAFLLPIISNIFSIILNKITSIKNYLIVGLSFISVIFIFLTYYIYNSNKTIKLENIYLKNTIKAQNDLYLLQDKKNKEQKKLISQYEKEIDSINIKKYETDNKIDYNKINEEERKNEILINEIVKKINEDSNNYN